jgi:hypothetical protein
MMIRLWDFYSEYQAKGVPRGIAGALDYPLSKMHKDTAVESS